MTEYNKLVRDKIPEIIQAAGEKPITRILDDKQYLVELIRKISEEQQELSAADTIEQQLEELADIEELVQAIAKHLADLQTLEEIRQSKSKKRGGFDKKIFLERTE